MNDFDNKESERFKSFAKKQQSNQVFEYEFELLKGTCGTLYKMAMQVRQKCIFGDARHTPCDSDCYEAITEELMDDLNETIQKIDNYMKIIKSYDEVE